MKIETPSFVLELPLDTTPIQETVILARLEAGRQLYNACLGEALKRFDLIRQSREFQKVIVLPEDVERTDKFKNLNKEYGFTEYAIERLYELWNLPASAVERVSRGRTSGQIVNHHPTSWVACSMRSKGNWLIRRH